MLCRLRASGVIYPPSRHDRHLLQTSKTSELLTAKWPPLFRLIKLYSMLSPQIWSTRTETNTMQTGLCEVEASRLSVLAARSECVGATFPSHGSFLNVPQCRPPQIEALKASLSMRTGAHLEAVASPCRKRQTGYAFHAQLEKLQVSVSAGASPHLEAVANRIGWRAGAEWEWEEFKKNDPAAYARWRSNCEDSS